MTYSMNILRQCVGYPCFYFINGYMNYGFIKVTHLLLNASDELIIVSGDKHESIFSYVISYHNVKYVPAYDSLSKNNPSLKKLIFYGK